LVQNVFSSNSIPEPEQIKKNLLTSAEVICSTSLDNNAHWILLLAKVRHWRGNAEINSGHCKDTANMREVFETPNLCQPHCIKQHVTYKQM